MKQMESITWHFESLEKGCALVATSERGIVALYLGNDETGLLEDLRQDFPHSSVAPEKSFQPVLNSDGRPAMPVPPLDLRGTEFQRKVWHALQSIPEGQTRTYGEIAASTGNPGAARAVGQACGANKLAVLVPCHRALPANGGMGGFRWGAYWKEWLLQMEAVPRRKTA